MARATLRHVEPAWRGDCVEGVLEAIALDYAAADVNGQLLAGDTFAAAHWSKVGPAGNQNPWKGPGAPAGTPVRKIAPEQWQALTPYLATATERPALLVDIIAAIDGNDFTPCFDIKPGEGTHQVRPYALLKAAAVVHAQPIVVMTEQWSHVLKTKDARAKWEASAKLRLKAAKAAGLPTMLLWREQIPATSDWWPLLDAVKGAPASQTLPAGVVRVPLTATTATARTVLAKVTAKVDWTPQEVPVVTPLRIDGVDLSHYQSGALDFAAFAAAGGRFVYHKATEGDTVTDAYYARRVSEVRAAGLIVGAYHFAHPDSSSGVDQAARFLSVARPMSGDMRPALDLETTGGLNQVELTKWVGAFVGEVKRQLGVLPVIYTNKNLTSDFGCPLWVARYSNSNAAPIIPTPFTRISIRQFSNGVYGVPKSAPGLGNVDLDTLPDGVKLDDLQIPAATPTTPEVPVADDRYERVTFRGRTVDRYTMQALEAVEADLGYELTITQGSYNAGKVSASAGTHDGGGVVDLAPWDWERKVRSLREHGFAAWHRSPIPNLWPEHIHAVQAGNEKAAPSAQRQVAAYKAGRNGLANNGPDDGPRIPLTPFKYKQEDDMPTPEETRAIVRDEIAKARPKVTVPADWSDKDKDGKQVGVGDALEMVMRELIRQRKAL